MGQADGSKSSMRYDRFVKKGAAGGGTARIARFRHHDEGIFARNPQVFKGARVLDIMSSTGFWSLAASKAGAAHVTGIEALPARVEAANTAFGEEGVKADTFRFVRADISSSLRNFEPDTFDTVMSHGFLEQSDPRFFFQQMSRLRAKFVVLDTAVVKGKGPIVRLRLKPADPSKPKATSRYNLIQSIPNHELITFFADYFQFRWRMIDWKTMGITDWTGLNDYEQDHRRTYVLERTATSAVDPDDD